MCNLFKKFVPFAKPPVTNNQDVSDGYISAVVEDVMPENVIQPLDLLKVTFDKSPNQSDRKDIVRAIVLHDTGPGSFNGIVRWLKDPIAQAAAHYVVGPNGELTQLVNTSKKAWHAGVSVFYIDGVVRKDLNHCTIGIEICNTGFMFEHDGKIYYEVAGRKDAVEWKGITPVKAQITYPSGRVLSGYYAPHAAETINKVISLCKALVIKYPNIGKEDILTHYQIATPEGRKTDPFGLDMNDIVNRIFE